MPSVTHVFNFDVPSHPEDYVHRIGRTGRAGREGKAITICQPSDEKNLEAVEKLLERTIPRVEVAAPAPAAEASAAVQEAPAPAIEEPKAEPADQKPTERKRSSRPRSRSGQDDKGRPVVGMGDHLPSFIEKSFEERMT